MKIILPYLIGIAFIGLAGDAIAQEKEIIVHEAWTVHMESAGGRVAMDRGFYGKLKIREFHGEPGVSAIQAVANSVKAGNIGFGVDSPENIILAREKGGIELVALSVDFQNSAMRIISHNPVRSSKDIRGNFGIWPGYEMKAKCVVGKGWERQFAIISQGMDIQPWLTGTWPLASAMTYNELITAQREMKKKGEKFYTVDYKDLGIDWMDNVLFTTEEIVKKYPEVVRAVVTGRYKGFEWALRNPKDAFEILKKLDVGLNYAHEMDAVSPIKILMITPDTRKNGLGYVLPQKWKNIAGDMMKAGLLEKMPDLEKIYTEQFPSGVMPR